MKKINFKLFIMLIAVGVLVACQKDEEEDPVAPVVHQDNSLIIAQNNTSAYVIVSPSSGEIKSEVQPAVISLEDWALGYQSQKAVITSKEPGGTFVKVIYTCDRATGNNLFQVTSENDFDVMQMDVSSIGPNIVFAAQDVNNLSDDQIHRINENGSGYQQLTFKDEGIECPCKVATKMIAAYEPAWSPNGSKIVFNGKLREIVTNHPHDAVIIMDAFGGNKEVLYSQPLNTVNLSDLCWTRDGKFLVFQMGLGNEIQVKVLNVNTLDMTDITSQMLVEGLHPTNLWTSPTENKIVFNKYEPGGGDLYTIEYTITDTGQFVVSGTPIMLASHDATEKHFGKPHWQVYPVNE